MEQVLAGRYQIRSHLGGGGFGQTFLAADNHLPGSPVCVVKQLKPKIDDLATLETAKRLFEQEAEMLHRLGTHAQIPRLLAHFEQNGEFYLVQEFVEGQPLDQELTPGKRLNEPAVVALLQNILSVLAFVHQQNVIHRDIKPANLIRRKQDQNIVLIDFGAVKDISKQAASARGQTNLTIAIGSPGYMASEQQAFRPRLSSDVYAVGMIGLQALTGLPPKDLPQDPDTGEFSCDLLKDLVRISSPLAAILDRMVRYDFRDRYRDAMEVLPALQGISDHPVSSQAETTVLMLSQVTPVPQRDTRVSTSSVMLDDRAGQVPLDSPFYVERPPIEAECYQSIAQPGALLLIKAPRQMGKTSLTSRVLHYAKTQLGFNSVYLLFQEADDDQFFANLDIFLQWFCTTLTYELGFEDKVADFWKGGMLGPKQKCTNYFQRYLLPQIQTSLVLGLDDVDVLFEYFEVAEGFFELLRAWHERSKNEDAWKKLHLAINHSQEVYLSLNINKSPFNVGKSIKLPEFNANQVQELVQRHNLDWSEAEIAQVIGLVDGHPYLVRVALYQIASGRSTLKQFLQIAPTEEGPYANHLRNHLSKLEHDPQLGEAMRQVVMADQPIQLDSALQFKLCSMGLAEWHGNAIAPLCNLYRIYFRDRLNLI